MIDQRIKKLMEQHPDLFPTEARFWSWLRGCLRRGVWERSPMKIKFKNGNCSAPPSSYTGKGKSGAYCALCGEWDCKSKLEVDHKDGGVPFTAEDHIIPFIDHLLATGDELQLVTKQAHKIKSYADRKGISYEEAVIEKEVIAFDKLKIKEQQKVFEQTGLEFLSTKKQRKEAYREYLKEQE